MNINLNGQAFDFQGRTIEDLIRETAPQKPFAVALNTAFIAKSAYADTLIGDNDQIEIVRPVVGG